jgi:hypothetical protein
MNKAKPQRPKSHILESKSKYHFEQSLPESWQLVSCMSLREFPHFPHRPLVVQKTKTYRFDLSMCLWYIHSFQPITRQELLSYLSSTPFHFIPLSFHAYTSAPHGFGSLLPFHSARSIHAVSHYPSPFPTHFQWLFLFLRRVPQLNA